MTSNQPPVRDSHGKERAGGMGQIAAAQLGGEGGQMPLQRRLPKRGFRSVHRGRGAEVRLHELTLVAGGEVDLAALKAAGVVNRHALRAKVIASGKIDTPVTLRGVGTTAGARKAIEQAGGRVED